MTEQEFGEFVAESIPGYAAEKVASGEWSPVESLDLARQAFDKLLPQGLATEGNHLFTVRAAADGPALGVLWYAVQKRGGTRVAYVYEIRIYPEHQRKGHGSGALFALESEVKRQGLTGIALHVFGHNLGAQALYLKLGFVPTDLNMFKPVRQ